MRPRGCRGSRFTWLKVTPLAALVALGCQPGDQAHVPTADSVATAAPTPWYRRARTLDLSADGQPDTVRLEAFGTRPDSLRITLSLSVDGAVKHREAWGSSYEVALLDSATRASPRVESFLRAQLDTVLASVVVQSLDAPGVKLMKEDSATLAALEPRPTQRISFSYGYETTVRLVWDAPRARFVRLWSCC